MSMGVKLSDVSGKTEHHDGATVATEMFREIPGSMVCVTGTIFRGF